MAVAFQASARFKGFMHGYAGRGFQLLVTGKTQAGHWQGQPCGVYCIRVTCTCQVTPAALPKPGMPVFSLGKSLVTAGGDTAFTSLAAARLTTEKGCCNHQQQHCCLPYVYNPNHRRKYLALLEWGSWQSTHAIL